MQDNFFKYSNSVIAFPLFFVLFLWLLYWLQINYDFDFFEFGIYPRTFSGLKGIFFSPFIHSNLEHLYNNSIPLLVLLAALCYFYRQQFYSIIFFGILLSGAITWIIARDSYHIGASSLIYVLVSFIFFKGIKTKYYRLVALSLTVVLVYGSMIWYVFPKVDDNLSWEGHLSGLITGFLFNMYYTTPEYDKVYKYDWEHPDFDPKTDKFMQRFDDNGNFVNLPPVEKIEVTPEYFSSSHSVHYSLVANKKDDISLADI